MVSHKELWNYVGGLEGEVEAVEASLEKLKKRFAQCDYCGSYDFVGKLRKFRRHSSGDFYYLHPDCDRDEHGLEVCPRCKGRGEIHKETDGDS